MIALYGILTIICFACIPFYKTPRDEGVCIASSVFFFIWFMFNLFELPDLTPDWSMSINWSVNFILLGALIALNAHHLLKKVCFTGLLLHTFGFFIAVVDWMDYALLYTQSTIALSVLFTILLMALSDAGNRNHRCNQTRTYVLRLLSNPGKA